MSMIHFNFSLQCISHLLLFILFPSFPKPDSLRWNAVWDLGLVFIPKWPEQGKSLTFRLGHIPALVQSTLFGLQHTIGLSPAPMC